MTTATRTVNANDLLTLFQTHRIRETGIEFVIVQRGPSGIIVVQFADGSSNTFDGDDTFHVQLEPR